MPLPIPSNPNLPSKQSKKSESAGEALPALPELPSLDDEVTEEDRQEDKDSGWQIDPKTGKKHRVLPKSEYDAEGIPVLQVDIDTNNLNSSADEFLAHLRVAPTKDEIQKMREEYAAKRRAEKEL